jgi:hypothetical protein
VLAGVLRTDRARLRPLTPASPATVALRQACRARKDLVGHRVAVGNQLRAHLLVAFPAAVGLFCKLHSAISLAFLARFDCQDRAGWLSEKRLAAWLTAASYSGRTSPADLYQRLQSAPRGATGEEGAASAQVTGALAAVLASLNTQIKALEAQIAAQLAGHADGRTFTSLPRSGTVRAARLLAEIGDCRARLPEPQALICLAGAAPSTRQSGKHKAVTFRWAVGGVSYLPCQGAGRRNGMASPPMRPPHRCTRSSPAPSSRADRHRRRVAGLPRTGGSRLHPRTPQPGRRPRPRSGEMGGKILGVDLLPSLPPLVLIKGPSVHRNSGIPSNG